MNFERRLGKQDVDAAALFEAARSFRPSARCRRRTLRALGLPLGLTFFGSSLAHAAYVLSSSLKGWGMVAGVVATVGAAGSVTYVVSTAPSTPSPFVSKQKPSAPLSPTPKPSPPAAVSVPVRTPSELAAAESPAVPGVVPVPGRRLAMRAEPRAVPRPLAARDPGQLPVVPSPPALLDPAAGPAARPLESLAPPPFRMPPPARPFAPSEPSSMSRSSPLKGELVLIADAQARLRAGDAIEALTALERHRLLYPGGALAEEAELLRIRAFSAKGDARAAHEIGKAFLQTHPSSPLVARFRSLMNALDVQRAPSPNSEHGEVQ